MTRSAVYAVILVASLLGGRSVVADEIADARKAFLSGMKHFDLGEYKDALADFKDGYRAKEDPVFLYNIAQCYRAMNQKTDALRYYRTYLSRSPDAPNRAEVEQKIVTLQNAIDADRSAASPSIVGTPTPSPTPSDSTATQKSATSAISVSAAPSARTPVYKRWWLWTIVGAAAVGIGVGVGFAIADGSSKASGTTFPVAAF